jgi:ubiquinone/menaquinone biosynthesis C-methylase UbiE
MPTNEELKAAQRAVWDAVSSGWDKWDRFHEQQTVPITEWLCREAAIEPGTRVLDLASGSGQPALTAAALARPGVVVATDIAPEMVEVIRRLAAAAGVDNLEARVMDMERLEYPDGSFDAVTCRWGYMFCPDVVGALAESRRVLRPGGRLSLAVWDVPAKNAWLTGIVDAINEVAPPTTPPDPKALGPFRLCDRNELEGMMRAAGFDSPRLESVPFSFDCESGETWWEFVFDIAAPVRNRILALDEDLQAKVKQIVLSRAAMQAEANGRVRLEAANLCAVGTK